MLDYSLLVRSK